MCMWKSKTVQCSGSDRSDHQDGAKPNLLLRWVIGVGTKPSLGTDIAYTVLISVNG